MLIRLPLLRSQACFTALTLLLSLGGTAALAQPVGPQSQEPRLTPEQRQKVFPEQRRLALQDHRARIAILQRGETCLQTAANADALRSCMRAEREAMRQQRRQHMGSLQALYERNGLPAPQWMKHPGKSQGLGPDWGGSGI